LMTTSDSSHCAPQLWLMQVNTVISSLSHPRDVFVRAEAF
jgi:hypothetical protein